jgi:murein DD-endopeptidase MepM/ murein hydrolase activator NlpD
MSTATLPDNKEDQDKAHNPGQADYDRKFNDIASSYSSAEQDLQKLENYANNPEGGDKEIASTPQDVQDQEQRGGYVNKFTGRQSQKKAALTIKDWKKLSPAAIIALLLGGGGGLLSILFTPALAFMDAKEAVFDDLNDSLGAMQIQTDHLLRTKLKTMQAGFSICTKAVSVRCKFATMSPQEIQNFKNAGFTVEADPKKFGNNVKPTAFITKDGVRISNPSELTAFSRTTTGRAMLLEAFNPRLYGTSDSKAKAVFGFARTHKGSKLPEKASEEDMAKAMDKAVSGLAAEGDFKPYQTEKGADGKDRKFIIAPDNTKVYEDANPARFNELSTESTAKFNEIKNQIDASSVEAPAASKFLSGVGKGVSVTGGLDTACSVYNSARAVSAMAKVMRAIPLIQYLVFVGSVGSDEIKAGQGNATAISFLGNLAMSADTNKTVIDESSIIGVNADGTLKYAEKPNPFYGATMFDAPWLGTVKRGDVMTPNARMQQYMVGGGLVGTLNTVMTSIEDLLGGRAGIRKTCGVVQSWWVRGAGLVAGIFLAAGSFGASTALSIGASMAMNFAMPFLEATMADMIKGTSVSSKTKGVEMGLAFVSGAGALFSRLSPARGLRAGNQEQIRQFSYATADIKKELIAVEVEKAKKTPFDITSQYSFLGSFARTLNPTIIKSRTTVANAVTAIPQLLGVAARSVIPKANAQQAFKPERFEQCKNDVGYAEIGIDADVGCWPRFIMTPTQLALDPDQTAVWMEQNGHINDEGAAQSDLYKDWLANCTEQRQAGLGETFDNENASDFDTGKACVGSSEMLDYFGAFYGFFGLNNAMNEDISTPSEQSNNSENGQVVSPVAGLVTITSGYGPRGSVGGAVGATSWHAAIDMVSNNKDVFAAMAGEVVGVQGSGVNVVAIKHADGLVTRYLHMEPKDVTVKVGDKVTAGQKIGIIGCAGQDQGFCSGDHLDFNVWVDGVKDKSKYQKYKLAPPEAGNSAGKAINPANFLTNNGVKGYESAVNEK